MINVHEFRTAFSQIKLESENCVALAIQIFPNWMKFQEVAAALIYKSIANRVLAIYDEMQTVPGAFQYAPESKAQANAVVLKHWSCDISVFAEILTQLDDEFIPPFALYGIKLISDSKDMIIKLIFQSDDPMSQLQKFRDAHGN